VNDFLDFLPTIPIIDVRRQVETNERPGTAGQTRPSYSTQEAMVVNSFTEILSMPQSNCADKALPGSEPVDYFLESLPGPSKTFLNFYSLTGEKLGVSLTRPPEKKTRQSTDY